MIKVYKALAHNGQNYVSSGAIGQAEQIYTPHTWVRCSNMFVFLDEASARAYARSSSIWEAETPEVHTAPEMILLMGYTDEHYEEFWRHRGRTIPHHMLTDTPYGSALCNSLRLIKCVKGF